MRELSPQATEGEKMFGFSQIFGIIRMFLYISPPVSFADSPLVRGGLFLKTDFFDSLTLFYIVYHKPFHFASVVQFGTNLFALETVGEGVKI